MAYSAQLPENNPDNSNIFQEFDLRKRFNSFFHHGWDFILKESVNSAWKTVKKFKLTEQKCWYKFTNPQEIVGLRFGKTTNYGLYDIDLNSQYDPREQEAALKALKAELEEYGINSFVMIQSSDSGGLHLYFFLARAVNSFRLACVMNKAAVKARLEIKRGQLETFPNTKKFDSKFNGHRLPLQQGSCLLDKDYFFYSDNLEHFLNAAEWSAANNDVDLLESKLEPAYQWFKENKSKEKSYQLTDKDKDFIEQVEYAQREIKEGFLNQMILRVGKGFSDHGQTNDLLLTIAKLGRILYGLSGSSYVKYLQETVRSCQGYLQFCRHQKEIDRRCEEVATYGEKHWYPYRSSKIHNRLTYKAIKQSLTDKTNLLLEIKYNAQKRLKITVAELEKAGKLPVKVYERQKAIVDKAKELFGMRFSDRTLRKSDYLVLWHPKHYQAKTVIQELQTNSIIQEPLQSKESFDKDQIIYAPGSDVTQQKPQNSKSLKSIANQSSEVLCPRFVLMKGECKLALINFYRCQIERAYCESLINSQNIVLKLKPVKRAEKQIKQQQIQQAQQAQQTKVARQSNAVYDQQFISGLIKIRGSKDRLRKSISIEERVIILTHQLHSSYFRDDPKQILVYVKPLVKRDVWRSGIAVPLERLEFLELEDNDF